MSSTQVYIYMAIAAAVAYGVFLLGFGWQRRTRPHRRLLAVLAAALCIAAPFVALRFGAAEPALHLARSLIGAAAGVSGLALFALLSAPSRGEAPVPGDVPETADGLVKFDIDADGSAVDVAHDTARERDEDNAHTTVRTHIDAATDRGHFDVEDPNSTDGSAERVEISESVDASIEPAVSANLDETESDTTATDDSASTDRGFMDSEFMGNNPEPLELVDDHAGMVGDAFTDTTSIAAELQDQDSLSRELDETEELYMQLRSEADEQVELPDDSPWLDETAQKEMNLDDLSRDDMVAADRTASSLHGEPELIQDADGYRNEFDQDSSTTADVQSSDTVEDAEWLDDDQAVEAPVTIAGGAPHIRSVRSDRDVTDDQPHLQPQSEALSTIEQDDGSVIVDDGETTPRQAFPAHVELDAALLAARRQGDALASQMTELQHEMESEDARSLREKLAVSTRETDAETRVLRAERLVQAEREARIAAEALVDSQRELIDELRLDADRIRTRITSLEAAQAEAEADITRLNETARHAAQLARTAAIARREAQAEIAVEREAKIRQEQATKRAVGIARNAIAALAEREGREPADR